MHAHVAPPPRAALGLLVRRCATAGIVATLAASLASDVVDAAGAQARSVGIASLARASATIRRTPVKTWAAPQLSGACPPHRRLPPRSEPDATTSGPITYGGRPSLDRSQIRAVFVGHRDELLACAAGADPRVDAVFRVCEDGRVAGAAAAGGDDAASACVARVLAAWWFPRPSFGGEVQVTVPLLLQDGARADLMHLPRDADGRFGDVDRWD